MCNVRINVQRLAMTVLSSLIFPIMIALLIDINLGWMPLLTIIASVTFIPVSSVIVIRAILAEMDRVIEQVAPLGLDTQDLNSEH